jgi:hypothetical protein
MLAAPSFAIDLALTARSAIAFERMQQYASCAPVPNLILSIGPPFIMSCWCNASAAAPQFQKAEGSRIEFLNVDIRRLVYARRLLRVVHIPQLPARLCETARHRITSSRFLNMDES